MTRQHQTVARQADPAQRARQASSAVRESDPQQLQHAVSDPTHASPAALLTLQQRYGNRAVTQLVSRAPVPLIQTKLSVGASGDVFEREADHVAAEVMRSSADHAGSEQSTLAQPLVQRKSNKPQTVVKQRSGPQIQLKGKNRRTRKRAAKQSTTLMIAPPPKPLMIAPPPKKGDVKPSTGEKEKPATGPLLIAPPTKENATSGVTETPTGEQATETPKEETTASESTGESHPVADKLGIGADLLNDIVDVKDAYYEYQKSGSKIETMGAIAKGGGKSVSAIQNASLLTGAIDKDSQVLSYSTAVSQGAAIVAAGAESYKAFNELRDNWTWSYDMIWENKSRIGALVEKVMDVVKGVVDIVKTFFESYKDFELPLLDKIKQAAVIVQKVQSFRAAWTRFVAIKSKRAAVSARDKVEVVEHLVNLAWDQMKQSAWEILAAGVNLSASFAKGTGVGAVYGYLIELGGKIAEGGGKAYVSGLRGARESGYTPGWLFDKNKTTEKRKEIARKIKRMGAAYLYEAVGLGPADHGDLAKIEEALAQPN